MGIFDKLFGRKKVEETTKPNNEKKTVTKNTATPKNTPEKKGPSKLDIHKEHQSFMIEERKKKKKPLANPKEDLSSYTESSSFTTSHLQHPPDVIPAEQVSEFANNFKEVSTRNHPILDDFDGRKAFLFAEIFNRRSY